MRRIDELHLAWPWMGSRSIRDQLVRSGFPVCRDRVRRLMRKMNIHAVHRAPRTSVTAPGHKIYPYLLKDLVIDHPNQVWCADTTYLPMARGFLCLVAIMDWHSRKVLSWRLSNILTADFCVEALDEALRRFGTPEIFNTDQGSQFTGKDFIDRLKDAGVLISLDGKGRWIDNVFIERLVAQREIRGGLPEGLRVRGRCPDRPAKLLSLLQHPADTPVAWQSHTG